jgi:hypothetical protein
VIKLADAYSHKYAVKVIFMNAPIALIAMTHAHPLFQSTDLTGTVFFGLPANLNVAVLKVAEGVILNDEQMQQRSKYHKQSDEWLPVRINEEKGDYRVNYD